MWGGKGDDIALISSSDKSNEPHTHKHELVNGYLLLFRAGDAYAVQRFARYLRSLHS